MHVHFILLSSSSATWSSGSTFLTKLLTHYPGVFLTFEPLVLTNPRTSLDEKHEDEARQLIKDLFSCNYDVKSKGRKFLNFIEDKSKWSYFHFYLLRFFLTENGFGWIVLHNMRTRIFCEAAVDGTNELCFDPNFVQSLCHVHPVQLIKTVRMRTRQIVPLLSSDPDIKFIVLLRDPRAIRSSRNRLPWCTFEACSHPKVVIFFYIRHYVHYQLFWVFSTFSYFVITILKTFNMLRNLKKSFRRTYLLSNMKNLFPSLRSLSQWFLRWGNVYLIF